MWVIYYNRVCGGDTWQCGWWGPRGVHARRVGGGGRFLLRSPERPINSILEKYIWPQVVWIKALRSTINLILSIPIFSLPTIKKSVKCFLYLFVFLFYTRGTFLYFHMNVFQKSYKVNRYIN